METEWNTNMKHFYFYVIVSFVSTLLKLSFLCTLFGQHLF